jgi:hypothetical protein
MVSSLLHVLIVTPVVFYWLRARDLPAGDPIALAAPRPSGRRRKVAIVVMAAAAIALFAAAGWWGSQHGSGAPGNLKTIQAVTSGDVHVVLLNPAGVLRQGRSDFVVEFRSVRTGRLIDAGTVRVEANMSMPGMPMSGGIEASAMPTRGRYGAIAQFGMSGGWKMTVQWDGPAGRGSVALEGNVQ